MLFSYHSTNGTGGRDGGLRTNITHVPIGMLLVQFQ